MYDVLIKTFAFAISSDEFLYYLFNIYFIRFVSVFMGVYVTQ